MAGHLSPAHGPDAHYALDRRHHRGRHRKLRRHGHPPRHPVHQRRDLLLRDLQGRQRRRRAQGLPQAVGDGQARRQVAKHERLPHRPRRPRPPRRGLRRPRRQLRQRGRDRGRPVRDDRRVAPGEVPAGGRVQDGLDGDAGGGGGHRGDHGPEHLLRQDGRHAPERGLLRRQPADPAAPGDVRAGGAVGDAVQHRLHLPARRRQPRERQHPRRAPQGVRGYRKGVAVLCGGGAGGLHPPGRRDRHHHHPRRRLQAPIRARGHRDEARGDRGAGGDGHALHGQDGHPDPQQDGDTGGLPNLRCGGGPCVAPPPRRPRHQVARAAPRRPRRYGPPPHGPGPSALRGLRADQPRPLRRPPPPHRGHDPRPGWPRLPRDQGGAGRGTGALPQRRRRRRPRQD
mmetsp:Transcript_53716/g.112106  ORF Transcript_53716/g.112106 Transcript_53716/m.112106 type:complete len:398 (-) Transcript_53716:1135-2328(-)